MWRDSTINVVDHQGLAVPAERFERRLERADIGTDQQASAIQRFP
jgi:hypothetical protein